MNHMPGAVLRTLRQRAGLTAEEVADRAKVTESYLLQVETGRIIPSDAWLGHVAAILADELINNPDPPLPPPAAA